MIIPFASDGGKPGQRIVVTSRVTFAHTDSTAVRVAKQEALSNANIVEGADSLMSHSSLRKSLDPAQLPAVIFMQLNESP